MSTAYQCRTCNTVGIKNFYKNARYQCKVCWNKRTYQSSRDNLDLLISERGGKCQRCGYKKSYAALQWHHVDPSQKEFGISSKRGAPLAQLREEVEKCKLVCANCHAEIHEELGYK